MNSNDNNLQSVGWGLIALGIIGWIIISILNEFRQAPWQFITVFIPHSAPQTVPEGNYGDEKSKLA